MKLQYNSLTLKTFTLFTLATIIFLFSFGSTPPTKKPKKNYSNGDSVEVEKLCASAKEALLNKNPDQAISFGEKALELSNKTEFARGKGKAYVVLGNAYNMKDNLSASLNYFLQSARIFEGLKDNGGLSESYSATGDLYMKWRAYEKAINYFKQAYSVKSGDNTISAKLLKNIGDCQFNLEAFPMALQSYTELLETNKKANDKPQIAETLGLLAITSKASEKYQEALNYNKQRLEVCKEMGDKICSANTLNNIGFVYKKLGDNESALNHFKQSLGEFEQLTEKQKTDPVVLNNIGVAYTNLGDYRNAKDYYSRSMTLSQKMKSTEGEAKALNYLAANYYISGNNSQALGSVQKAIEIAETNGHRDVLQESYKILSEIYNREENYKESQKYYKMHKDLLDQLAAEQRKKDEEVLQNLIEAEKKESEYRMVIADKEKQDLALKQLKLEAEKQQQDLAIREKEVAILKQQKDLQEANLKSAQLEKERVRQSLEIANQQLEAEKRNKAIADLQKEKELQDLALKQKELEERERQKAIELLESEKKLQDQQLQEEKTLRKYGYGIIVLILAILGIIAFSFYQKQKASRLLKKQSDEIQKQAMDLKTKNEQLLVTEEELRQNMEELETTQEKLKAQNSVLEKTYADLEEKNTHITDSIRYAQTIQNALLPTNALIASKFPENFIIFLPKDVVSGDFYWMNHTDDHKKVFMAVVDCTGHGVPGAFMSMIGSSLLNQVVMEKGTHDPAKILEEINHGIIKSLRQADTTNTDGMDVVFCTIEPSEFDGRFTVKFCGAKNSLYYVSGGEFYEIKGDRKSIGGIQKEGGKKFNTQTIQVKKGDILYLTTDGFVDTANEERKRYGTIRFKEVLLKNWDKSLSAQKDALLLSLREFQGNTPQRDDVTFVAIKV
jgi:serine phosphatase RsbU (regulator of sigma subunit)/tetratricopeptide (TPR) repeat protein